MRPLLSIAGATSLLSLATLALAGTDTASFYNGGGGANTFAQATGWRFIALTDMVVDQLGVYDFDTPGLADSHDVGLFTTGGTLIVAGTVPAGTGASLIDGSRFINVSPEVLHAGGSYYLLATNWSIDRFVFGVNGPVTYATQIAWNGTIDGLTNTIFSQTTGPTFGAQGNLGPNFRFIVGIPEPSGMFALILPLAALKRRARP
ncbi:MAG: hypothetical protein ACREJC_21800 [Tepidisphaeraceae bacterium]